MFRSCMLIVLCCLVSACAYYLTPRPPIMERKLGAPGNESIGALATAPDYRLAYVRIKSGAKFCAEPPPDAAGQFAATIAGSLSAPLHDKNLSLDAQASLALSMKQLFKRSQGIQFYRDGLFALCNLYVNGGITESQYFQEMQALRLSSETLIKIEIPYLEKISIDPITTPALVPVVTVSKPLAAEPNAVDGTPASSKP